MSWAVMQAHGWGVRVGGLPSKNSKDAEDTASWVQMLALTVTEATDRTRSLIPRTLVSPSVNLSFPFPLQCDGNSLDNCDNHCTKWLFLVYNKLISDVIIIITINDVREGPR